MVVRAFPRFRPFDYYYFMFSLAIKVFSFLLIGLLGYFGLGFTTLNRKAPLIACYVTDCSVNFHHVFTYEYV